MQLAKKKALAAKVLGIGKDRVIFVEGNLNEIKEAITRQDILDLYNAGSIKVREEKGRKKAEKRKNRKGIGKVRLRPNNSKGEYIIITRKLRKYIKFLLKTNKVDLEKYKKVRRLIKAKKFKSKRHLNELLGEL
jgi:large subunit ribosomal protein L19e